MSFIYYLPGRTKVSPAELRELGLTYVFKHLGQKHTRPVRQGGPDQGAGLIVACASRAKGEHVGYYPDRQTWKHYPAKNIWVGLPQGEQPGPDELKHDKPLPGELVTLADERQWLVPHARRWNAVDDELTWWNVLPQSLDMSADGHLLIGGPVAKYAVLWSIAEAERLLQDGTASEELRAEWTVEKAVLYAVQVLQANYAIGIVEALMLGLFTQENWRDVFDALNDWKGLDELISQKKSQQDPSDSESGESGPREDSPTTDPPSQTSSD